MSRVVPAVTSPALKYSAISLSVSPPSRAGPPVRTDAWTWTCTSMAVTEPGSIAMVTDHPFSRQRGLLHDHHVEIAVDGCAAAGSMTVLRQDDVIERVRRRL